MSRKTLVSAIWEAIVSSPAGVITAVAKSIASTPMVARGFSGQTADLQQWQDSSNAVLARLTAAGILVVGAFPSGSGMVAGDLSVSRGGASPGTGGVFFGSSPSQHYIFYDGSTFVFADGLNVPAGANVGIGTSSQYGAGAGAVGIANAATVPTTNPTGGGVLYSQAGALKWRGSSGTVTTIAPA